MGLLDFLHRFSGEQPRKKIQFSFGYVLADIDPDAELGPAVLREYTIIKYRVPDIEVYGEVAVAALAASVGVAFAVRKKD